MNTTRVLVPAAITLVAVCISVAPPTKAATIEFLGGNLANASSWDGGSKPSTGDLGTINVDGEIVVGNNLGLWMTGDPALVFGGNATVVATNVSGLTAFDPPGATNGDGDFGGTAVGSFTINNATIIARDDIFSNSSVMTFNVGSMATAADDFEANGGSTLNINGGTHSARDRFGAQNNSTVNLTGGTIAAANFRVASSGALNISGSAILSGGAGSNQSIDAAALLEGAISISSDWTGLWTIDALSVGDWETEVTGGDYTLDGTVIDAALFASSFTVSSNGQTLALINPIPEPSAMTLVVLAGLASIFRLSRYCSAV